MIKFAVCLGLVLTYLWNCSYYKDPQALVSVQPLEEAYIEQLKALNLTVRNPVKVNNQVVHGRFLHLTDVHPDPYYKPGSSPDQSCHKGTGDAGEYGDAILGCDSPITLMNETFKWINDNLKDKIDFIVWTGDNIRHDNDRNYPRTEMNIFDMNRHVSDLLYEMFKNPDTNNPRNLLVDLVPSLGNNDVYPHNLFAPGPTLQTREMFLIWSAFVPQNQFHIFNRGAYFFREIIPGQLAILSINTLYLYQSNPLVDNCDKRKEPGYKLFKWLGVVLNEMRARNMKVWLTGHVPPNEKNYDISCLRKYIIWSYEYRDVIVGGLYGHMNIDHFIPLDAKAAYKSLRKLMKKKDRKHIKIPDFEIDEDLEEESEEVYEQQDPIKIAGGVPKNKVNYMEGLRDELYGNIKRISNSGVDGERYSIAHVTASVIPTFNPGLRVWEYNITGLPEAIQNQRKFADWDQFFAGVDKYMNYLDDLDRFIDEEDEEASEWAPEFDKIDFLSANTKFDILKKKKSKKDKTIPPKKPEDIPLGPAYTNQLFSPLRYTQYYADLAEINKNSKPFKFEYEYSTDDKYYNMDDLLVESWLNLGRKLGQSANADKDKELATLWSKYLSHAFVDSNYENLGYG